MNKPPPKPPRPTRKTLKTKVNSQAELDGRVKSTAKEVAQGLIASLSVHSKTQPDNKELLELLGETNRIFSQELYSEFYKLLTDHN